MNWEKFISYIIIFAVITLLMTFMNKAAREAVNPSNDGKYMLRLHKLYLIVGLVGLSIGFFGIIAFLIYNNSEMLYFAVGMNVIFAPLGLICVLWYKNHSLIFDDKKVTAITWLGKSTSIEWENIEVLKFSAVSGQLALKGDHKTLKAHQHLVGLAVFIATLKNKRTELLLPRAVQGLI